MKIVLTGASGFLGWHTRLRLVSKTSHELRLVGRENWDSLSALLADADAVVHIAGVNRGSDNDVFDGNCKLATDLASAVRASGRPIRIVYAGTIKVAEDSPYGIAKRRAAEILGQAAAVSGGSFVDVVLPNLFGEHCKPHYNAFSATFIDHVINGTKPSIKDSKIGLLHAQDAAEFLIEGLTSSKARIDPQPFFTSVLEVWELLQEFHRSYVPSGEIPDLSSKFRIDLFNSYRAALFDTHCPIRLVSNVDSRGTFVETIRCRGGESQSAFSSTAPRVTRGEHYHLSKVERFVVIQGLGRIELRRMFSDKIFVFEMNGEKPMAIDMPIGWVHNITNIGDDILLTQFWSHELFRPESPDTFPATVRIKEKLS